MGLTPDISNKNAVGGRLSNIAILLVSIGALVGVGIVILITVIIVKSKVNAKRDLEEE